jgi:hypothetical protein
MRKVEAEIDAIKKQENIFGESVIHDWTVPACAFVTFDHDDAKELALELAESYSKEEANPQLTMTPEKR